jgi:two-component system, OmpR family, sensor histidine kinase MprB
MSLRWRWALSIAAVSMLAVAASTVIALVTTDRELRDQVDEDLVGRFAVATRAVPAVAPRGPFDRTDRDPFESRPGGRFDASQLVGLDAVVQVTVGEQTTVPGDPVLPTRPYDTLEDGPLLESIEVEGTSYRMISGQVQGLRLAPVERGVQIAIDVEDIDSATSRLVRRLGLTGLGLALVAGAAGGMLARNAVRPIEQLTAATDALAMSDDSDHPLPTDAPGEVGRLATSFGTMVASLRQSREQQQRLVADAGHEFRTPLTALVTNIDTLLRRETALTPDQRRELLEAAMEETTQLATLATELVDLAADAGTRADTHTDVDLTGLATAVAKRYATRTGHHIEVTGSGSPVTGRPHQLERAISNLVDNATKWSPPDQAIEIAVEGRSVTVKDRGPGIPEAHLPHVFERFHRAVESRSTPGSGLGLAIVEHIVASHGGAVFARNRPGGGSEVGFRLP